MNGLKYDPRWVPVSKVSEWDIIQTNTLFAETTSKLPLYWNQTTMKNSNYTLFERSYIEWSAECESHKSSMMKNLAENLNPINTLVNAQLFYMVVCFLSLLVLAVFTPAFVLVRHCMVLRGEARAAYKDVIISTGLRFMSAIFVVLKAAFLASCLALISKYRAVYAFARDHDCSDSTTLFVLGYVDESLGKARQDNWLGLVAVIVMGLLEAAAVVILFCLQRKVKQSESSKNESLITNINPNIQ